MSTTNTEHQYWEERSETFDEDVGYIVGAELNEDIKSWLQKQFMHTDVVLELGCGTGIFSEAVAPLVSELFATDMSELMLHEARNKLGAHGNVRFQKEDAYKTTFDSSAFDAVFMVNLLHIVDDPALILQEASRLLGSDGKVVVVDITSQGTPLMAGMRLGLRYLRRWGRGPASGRNLSLNQLARLTEEAGFLIKDQDLVGRTVKAASLVGYKTG